MICHLKYIFVWIFLLPQPTDGGSVTWYEPPPIKTTSNPGEELSPVIEVVNVTSPVTLDWSYSLTAGLGLGGFIKFNDDVIVTINGDGSAGPVNAKFQERYSFNSTLGKASLFISPVTVDDDKANGEFRCELIDSTPVTWKRAIQVQVIVPTNITGIRGEPTVLEGSNLQLNCEALGRPEPNITWTKEKPGNQGNTGVVQEGKVLTITNINRSDAGIFTCTAYNGFGKPEKQTVYLNVTYPAMIVNFQMEYFVVVQQSVTLNCGAEGNPPPTYTWTPCDSEQVCDKNALDISQFCEDVSYACNVANGLGSDTKTANVFIEGEWIVITINITDESCADGNYNESLLLTGFDKVFRKVFPRYERVEVRDNRCSTVKLALKFNPITNQTHVITSLRDAAKDGYLGKFPVCPTCINGAGSCNVTQPTPTPANPSNYPAMIIEFQTEYIVGLQQSVTLNCEAEGNPPPTYTWIPCDPEQVCNKKILDISQVLNDASYTCRVANVHGPDTKTAIVYIAGKVINITIVITSENCADEKYNKSSLLRKLEEELKRAFTGRLDYERVQSMSVRCGSIIVDLALKFNSTTKEQDVIITLNDALKDGKLGEYSVGSIKGKRPNMEPTGEDATSPPDGSYGGTICIIVGAVFGSVAALAVAGILVCWTCRKKRRNTKGTEEVAMSRRIFGNSNNERRESTNIAVESPTPSQSHYMALDDRARSQVIADASPLSTKQISEYASLDPYTRSYEIPREHVTIKQIIGKGAFSQVAKAAAYNLQGRTKKKLVAVKMLSENASESEKNNLLSELELMKQLKPHPYVIKLLGCVTKSEPLLVLIEYVPFGDLLGYLRKSRGLNDTYYKDPNIKPQTNLTSQQLMKFAWQIADGMSYLSSIPVIHRDLSARNVLVGEGKTCKVTDFGMARDVQEDNIYERKTRGRLPVKWTAIEALLYGKYSTKSDVWSYGILLYEIFTIGGSPYPRVDGRKIANLLQEGYRMPKPQHLDDKLYEIMTKCWRDEPNLRPSFEELRKKLSEMENQHKGLINLKNYDHQLYVNVEDLVV